MKAEDIKIGMRVKHKDFGEGNVVSLPSFNNGCTRCDVILDYYADKFSVKISNLEHIEPIEPVEPVEPPEFEWDTNVPTVGKPELLANGSYGILVDHTKSIIFSVPTEVYHCGVVETLRAIIFGREYPFVFNCGTAKSGVYLPVKHNQPKSKILELTMEEVNEKFGCVVKIISKGK